VVRKLEQTGSRFTRRTFGQNLESKGLRLGSHPRCHQNKILVIEKIKEFFARVTLVCFCQYFVFRLRPVSASKYEAIIGWSESESYWLIKEKQK
jgi:hypothetical protein